jgi:hypothetical protein
MKNTLSALFLLLVCGAAAQAQDLRLGIRVDPQLTWLNTDSEFLDSDGVQAGVKFGLLVDIGFSSNYALSTGVFLDNRGGQLSFDQQSSRYDPADHDNVFFREHSIQYLEIPLALRLRSNELGGADLRIYGQAGAKLGFRTQYQIDGEELVPGQAEPQSFSDRGFNSDTRFFNPSLFIGGGAEYPLDDQLAIMAGLTYNQGLISVSSIDDYQYRTGRLALQVGLLF